MQIDEHGIRTIGGAPEYLIEAEALLMTTIRYAETYYDWPLYMADKSWIDFEAFCEAFERAVIVLADRLQSFVDRRMLNTSFEKGRCSCQRRNWRS
jgi:hypothetical protein